MYVGLKQPRGDGERYVTPALAAAKETRQNRTNVRIYPDFHTFLCKFFTFLNACISLRTSPINTKLGDFVNLGVLFLTMWINSC